MNVNELRIGNLLYPIHLDGYAEVIEIMVSGIGIKKLGDGTQKSLVLTEYKHRLESIEITVEWLIRLGFKYDIDLKMMLIKGGISCNTDNFEFCYMGQKIKKKKYIHQIQNLYYALRDEELEIKNI